MSPKAARSSGLRWTTKRFGTSVRSRGGEALGLHRPLDPALELDRLEPGPEQARRWTLEEAFEEPLDGGQGRHGRSGSLAEGPGSPVGRVEAPGCVAVDGPSARSTGSTAVRRGVREPCAILSPLFGRSVGPSVFQRPVRGPDAGDPHRVLLRTVWHPLHVRDRARAATPGCKGSRSCRAACKNFVLSDDSSMDEAMAAARSETDREVTSQQLDAFHKTFNFCMICRQYTCGNCWNEAEGRCLYLRAALGHEIMPAPFGAVAAASAL